MQLDKNDNTIVTQIHCNSYQGNIGQNVSRNDAGFRIIAFIGSVWCNQSDSSKINSFILPIL